jgi:protein involved in polysaccharide export with SLBB domain
LTVLLLATAAFVAAQARLIAAGDTIKVACAEEAALNREYKVTADGVVVMDFLGVVAVVGLTEEQAAERIQKRLVDDRILRKATVSVRLLGAPAQPAKEEPAKTDPPKEEPAKQEPPKEEPTKPEPEKATPAQQDPVKQPRPSTDSDVATKRPPKTTVTNEAPAQKDPDKPGPETAGDRVSVMGAVEQPGAIEPGKEATVRSVIAAAGGLNAVADPSQVVLESADGTRRTLDLRDPAIDAPVGPGDKVTVAVVPGRRYIEIDGAVRNPGFVVHGERLTLLKAVEMAGGALPWAKLDVVEVVSPEPRSKPRIVNVSEIVQGFRGDVLLAPGEKVVVPGKRSRRDYGPLGAAAVVIAVWFLFGR